jgi:hypothetical protein
MTSHDLTARGFRKHSVLPQAWTYCPSCKGYRWFVWWVGPQHGWTVTTCAGCQQVEHHDEAFVARQPIVQHQRTA